MSEGLELVQKNEQVCALESASVPSDSCQDDDDIEPLSGKPYFDLILTRSNVGDTYKFQLILPHQFTQLLPNITVPVILTRGGRSWETTYLGDNAAYQKKFDQRWRSFAEDNMLKVGDACVFELMECSDTSLKFKVQVLRGDFPSILLGNQDGTIDNPIVVE